MINILSKLNPFKKSNKEASSSDGPDFSRTNTSPYSGGAKYPGGLSNFGNSMFLSNQRIRQNARSAFHDTPEAKSIVSRFADTVVDTGLKLECTPKANILGISNEEAEVWARDVESRFDIWAKTKKIDRRGLQNFYQMQRLYQICQQRDNDIFVRLYYSQGKKSVNPLQISILDPNQIKGDSLTSTYHFSSTFDGIKRNEKGEEIGYSVLTKDFKTGDIKYVEVPKSGRISGRTMMLHGFCPEYSGQSRGYSRLEHVLQEFEEITDFKLSTIKKAISQSQITMYTKPSNDNDASNPLEDIAFTSGPSLKSNGDATEDLPVPDIGCSVQYESVIPDVTTSIPGNIGVFNLKKGEDLIPFSTQATSENFKEFIEAYMSYVSASNGMPLEVLLMKFGQNYSASRGALLLFWRVVGIWRNEMESDFLNPTFESWLSEEIAAGRIQAPGFSDPILRQAWLDNRWIGAPMPNIDPMRTAKADMSYAEMGATTLDRIARDHNGSDGASNRRKLAKEFKELSIAKWNQTESEETEEDD